MPISRIQGIENAPLVVHDALKMPYFLECPQVLSPKIAQDFLRTMADSHLIGESPLAGSFRSTQGVAWVLTREGIAQLPARLPTLGPILEAMELPKGPSALRSRWKRLSKGSCNAFYLNLLLIPPGKKIAAHVDATLRKTTQIDTLLPEFVSVIWLELPPKSEGGELRFYDRSRPVGQVAPKVGTVVHFQGKLNHEVNPIVIPKSEPSSDKKPLRISLVCEQYQLPSSALNKLPPISTHTRAGFKAYLHHAKSKPTTSFEID